MIRTSGQEQTTTSRRRVTGLVAVLATAGSLATACASSSANSGQPAGHSSSGPGPAVTIRVKSLPGAGTVLVSSTGYALYMFEPDAQRQVTCTGLCAATWPPVKISAGARLVAGPGVRSSLLGSDPDPAGGRVVTYNGWPLYAYSGDVQPGQHTGQGIDLNGGVWYLMRPSGAPLSEGPG